MFHPPLLPSVGDGGEDEEEERDGGFEVTCGGQLEWRETAEGEEMKRKLTSLVASVDGEHFVADLTFFVYFLPEDKDVEVGLAIRDEIFPDPFHVINQVDFSWEEEEEEEEQPKNHQEDQQEDQEVSEKDSEVIEPPKKKQRKRPKGFGK